MSVSLLFFVLFCSCFIDASLAQQEIPPTSSCIGSNDTTTIVDVVIIGAGASGVSAYAELKRLDPTLNVIIVEATDRIGGRVKKTSFAGYNVELGASEISYRPTAFKEGSDIFYLAQGIGLGAFATTYTGLDMYDESGRSITPRFNTRVAQLQNKRDPFNVMFKSAKDYWDEESTYYDGSENIIDVMRQRSRYIERNEFDALFRWFMVDYDLTNNDIALLNFYYEDPYRDYLVSYFTGYEVFDDRGYESVISQFISPEQPLNIIFNTKVTDVLYGDDYGDAYSAVIKTVDTNTGACVNYGAKRTIVTVPVAVLRGNGYSINFQPPLALELLPYVPGHFVKVYFKFNTNFWNTTNGFLGILRPNVDRDLCNYWQNMNLPLPGSNILMCVMTDGGLEKYKTRSLQPTALLQPLRVVFGATVVDTAFVEVLMNKWDEDPAAGYHSYSRFVSGYTLDLHYAFYGGYNNNATFIQGEGYNMKNEWVVHLSGTSSCFEYYEYVDGGYYSGKRSAHNVLVSLGRTDVEPTLACEGL